VRLRQEGPDRVSVQGARGLPPGPAYKVSATRLDGYRCTAQLTVVGLDAASKARRTAEAILVRTRELFSAAGWADYTRTHIEVLGTEAGNFGPQARGADIREVVLQLGVMHPQKAALELFAREIAPAGTSWAPGTTGASGRPRPAPALRQFSFMIDKQRLGPQVLQGAQLRGVEVPWGQPPVPAPSKPEVPADVMQPGDDWIEVPLVRIAWARSGDKSDTVNVGVIARRPEWLALLRSQLTAQSVHAWLAHLVQGEVTRFEVPGIHAFNFLCTAALDGGGMASLRNDPLGKGMAQILLAMPVKMPPS
jgi:hypothetical protein